MIEAQSQHHYGTYVVASGGTLVLPDFQLSASGGPLEEDKVTDIFGLLRPQVTTSFFATSSGTILVSVLNRTEGLTATGGFLDFLIGDLTTANYRILLQDFGLDDHGQSPKAATQLPADGSSIEGALVSPEDWDYFVLPASAGMTYTLTLEASGNAVIRTGRIDRFDEFVSTTSGDIQFSVRASSGSPGVTTFTASSDEDILLGLKAGATTLLEGILGALPGFESFPVRYAITLEQE